MNETARPTASRRCAAAKGLPLALIMLAACTPQPQNPSPESKFLQSQLVPAINSWAKSNSQEMRLFAIPAVRSFDYLCIVPEYQDHSKIESELPVVREYRGRAGHLVPEMRMALVGTKGATAHVGYIVLNDLDLTRHSWKCHKTNRLVAKREKSKISVPLASLEEEL